MIEDTGTDEVPRHHLRMNTMKAMDLFRYACTQTRCISCSYHLIAQVGEECDSGAYYLKRSKSTNSIDREGSVLSL